MQLVYSSLFSSSAGVVALLLLLLSPFAFAVRARAPRPGRLTRHPFIICVFSLCYDIPLVELSQRRVYFASFLDVHFLLLRCIRRSRRAAHCFGSAPLLEFLACPFCEHFIFFFFCIYSSSLLTFFVFVRVVGFDSPLAAPSGCVEPYDVSFLWSLLSILLVKLPG